MSYYGLIECQYIFSTYNEYKKKKKLIIKNYLKYRLDKKYFYKLYIYSKPLLTKEQKDSIWEEINKKSELFDTIQEYNKKRMLIAKLYSKWDRQQLVMYRAYFFAKDIKEKRLIEMWEEINEYSAMLNGMDGEDESCNKYWGERFTR